MKSGGVERAIKASKRALRGRKQKKIAACGQLKVSVEFCMTCCLFS